MRRSQKGSNNAYCQDNEISWFGWIFVNQLFNGSANERGLKDVSWHGSKLKSPGWVDAGARALAMTLAGRRTACPSTAWTFPLCHDSMTIIPAELLIGLWFIIPLFRHVGAVAGAQTGGVANMASSLARLTRDSLRVSGASPDGKPKHVAQH